MAQRFRDDEARPLTGRLLGMSWLRSWQGASRCEDPHHRFRHAQVVGLVLLQSALRCKDPAHCFQRAQVVGLASKAPCAAEILTAGFSMPKWQAWSFCEAPCAAKILPTASNMPRCLAEFAICLALQES